MNGNSKLTPSNHNYLFLAPLYIIYDKNSVLYNQKPLDKSFSCLKSFQRFDRKKLPTFVTEAQASPRHKPKKPYKILLSKIMRTNGKNYLYIIDIVSFSSMIIHLESLFENPSKNHIIDPNTGYVFLYDNKGTISIIVAKITGEWREKTTDKDRKICSLTLFDKRVDPTMHLVDKSDGSLLLLVVGGIEDNNLMQDIQIFMINFERKINLQPLLRLKLRYPRIQPLIYHTKIKDANDVRIFILGGTSTKSLKKEGIYLKNELLEEGKKSVETICLRKIEDKLYKKEINGNNENNELTAMDQSFQIEGDDKLIKKLDSFSEGAVVKIRMGFHSAKSKMIFILGVGKSKGSIYQIEYMDEKGQTLHIIKKLQKVLSPGFLCNAMFKVNDKKLFYLSDSNKEKYDVMELKMLEGKGTAGKCSCDIF